MQIIIHGKQIETGEALQTHIRTQLTDMVGKYLDIPGEATITLSRNGAAFHVECTLHLSSGLTAQAHAEAHEVYASVDAAVKHLEKQLRRYKERRKDHHKRPAKSALANEHSE